MKFYGKGVVWDAMNNRVLCEFTDGELETSDNRTIQHLKKNGYAFDDAVMTKNDIMAELDRLGVTYDKRKKKADLEELLYERNKTD